MWDDYSPKNVTFYSGTYKGFNQGQPRNGVSI